MAMEVLFYIPKLNIIILHHLLPRAGLLSFDLLTMSHSISFLNAVTNLV